jgi:protein-disulfide isomerase
MTTENQSSRFPLYLLLIGGLCLGALAAYMFMRSGGDTSLTDTSLTARSEADEAAAIAGISSKDRKATEAVVRAYILDHPEIITEAIAILQGRELGSRVASAGDALTKAFAGDVSGNPNGDITIVEFTDYNCGFCRASVPDVEKLLANDKNIRLIYREVPILAETSRDAALMALAAAKQGKHDAFHKAMFATGKPDNQSILSAAAQAGLNVQEAKQFVNSAEAKAELENNLAMMQKIGFGGTPTFIINGEILQGAQGYDRLKAVVEKARKNS